MTTNHTDHGHLNTPADRAACRRFMADHDGMDAVTFRVTQRETELDDAFAEDDQTAAAYVRDNGCMYHKDDGACPVWPSPAYYDVSGDLWCQAGLDAHRAAMGGVVVATPFKL